MAERGPYMGRTSPLLARDVRPMYGPTVTGLTPKGAFTSRFNVRPDGPYIGRTWAGGASPGTGPGLTPARPAEPIGPDIAGRTSRPRAATAENTSRRLEIAMTVFTRPRPPYRLQAYPTRRPNRPPRNPIMEPWPCDRTRPGDR